MRSKKSLPIIYTMSLNYYLDNGKVVSGNDISEDKPMTDTNCNNFYFSNNPTGWFNDLGQQPIGKRPVHQRYHIGNHTCVAPTKYVQPGRFDCRQPCWGRQCK